MTTFKELGLNAEVLKGLDDLGFKEPSPVQEKAIPFVLKSKQDLIALAQTGTGKTAAFSLPIINQLKPGSKELTTIILSPTRELAIQIAQDIKKFSKHLKKISVTPVYGGENIMTQIRAIKKGTNIVVGTPGRVHDLIRRKVLKLGTIEWLVFDEADEMLDMGFKEDLDAILEDTPDTKQTLLFSATMSQSVRRIAGQYMKDAKEMSMGTKNIGADKVSHEYYVVGARDRFDALKRIIDCLPDIYGILFCRTRNETQVVADKLKQAGYDAEAIHGEIAQNIRTKMMDKFKRKQIKLLVATDVAARGIDVNDLTHVINYNLPDSNETYTHRSGRTGRAGKSGISVLIANPKDSRRVRMIEKIIGKKFELKKVPSEKDVFGKLMDTFYGEIKDQEGEEKKVDKQFEEFAEKLQKLKKDELVNYIIKSKFKPLVDSYKNSRDLNAKAKAAGKDKDRLADADSTNLKINLGRRDRFDIKALFGLINSSRKLKGAEIGKINLMSEYSVFSVEKERADDVLKALKGSKYKGKTVSISIGGNIGGFSGARGGKRVRGARGGSNSRRSSSRSGGYKGKNSK